MKKLTKTQTHHNNIIENITKNSEDVAIEKFFCDTITIIKHKKNNKSCALLLINKRKNPKWNYSFRNELQRETHIEEELASEERNFDREQEWKEKNNKPHTLKENDIIYNSWGYEQTNIDFYQIIRTTKKNVIFRQISQNKKYEGDMNGTTTPNKNDFIGEEIRRKVNGQNHVNFKFGCGNLWEGRALGFSCWH